MFHAGVHVSCRSVRFVPERTVHAELPELVPVHAADIFIVTDAFREGTVVIDYSSRMIYNHLLKHNISMLIPALSSCPSCLLPGCLLSWHQKGCLMRLFFAIPLPEPVKD